MLAAFRRPAGRLSPIRSRLSRNSRPPFFDLALQKYKNKQKKTPRLIIVIIFYHVHLINRVIAFYYGGKMRKRKSERERTNQRSVPAVQ